MRVARATGIFSGVRNAGLAGGAGQVLELSLDSWEAPLVFDVRVADRLSAGETVYHGTARTPMGTAEMIAIRVEADPPPSRAASGTIEGIRRAMVTRSTKSGPPDSVLELVG
ncbi:MAG: hypothetical protein AB7N65_02130 [Vicinamibacterales bacterium]